MLSNSVLQPSGPPTNNIITATNPKLSIKIEPQEQDQPIPNATAPLKPEQCRWGPNCPICKNAEEDWDGKHQKQLQPNQHKYSNTRYTADEFLLDPKHKANSGSGTSAHPRLPGTTKPSVHLDTILQCTR